MAVATPATVEHKHEIPRFRDLNYREIELFYDVDLDEYTVLFYGRARRHTLEEIAPNTYLLLDPATDDVVGLEFHNFIRKVVPHFPELADAVSLATILSEEPRVDNLEDGLAGRLYDTWKRIVTPRRAEVRELLASLRSVSQWNYGVHT